MDSRYMVFRDGPKAVRVNRRRMRRALDLMGKKDAAWKDSNGCETPEDWHRFKVERDRLNAEYADLVGTREYSIALAAGVLHSLRQMSAQVEAN